MKLTKTKNILFSLTTGSLLVAALIWVLVTTSRISYAAPGTLFASSGGSGTACTQSQPCSLETAVNQANAQDTVFVAQGIYTGTGTAVITLTKSISLYGGWDGTATGPVLRDPVAYRSVLDGQGQRRVMTIDGPIMPHVDGFTIRGGNATNAAIVAGGGIYGHSGAAPLITRNVITGNVASITDSQTGDGGGIALLTISGTAVISDNLIANNKGNSAVSGRGRGGGLFVTVSDQAVVRGNTFENNVAGDLFNSMGGGLYFYRTPATIRDNRIRGNKATPTATSGYGGGLYSQFGLLTLQRNTVISNVAGNGAITFESNATITLTNNIVVQNTGGVYVRANETFPLSGTLAHNTIAENSDEGIFVGFRTSGYSTVSLTNNIVVSHGTGIRVEPGLTNTVRADHTLFYGNSVDIDGSTITNTNAITGQAPRFVDAAAGNYHLRLESPAVDAGVSTSIVTDDIDGEARDDDADIGADEVQQRHLYLPVVVR